MTPCLSVAPAATAGRLSRLDGRVKVLVAFFFVLLVVQTPGQSGWALGGYGLCLALAWSASGRSPGRLLWRLLGLLPILLVVALGIPFLPQERVAESFGLEGAAGTAHLRWALFGALAAKALLGAAALILLTATTPPPELLRALERLRVPQSLVLIAGFTQRYLLVLVEEARRMKRACEARGYAGRWIGQARVFGPLLGVLFLRTYERGERVYLAMLARGFEGRFPRPAEGSLTRADLLGGGLAVLALLSIRLWAP